MKASLRGIVLPLLVTGLLCAGGIAVFQDSLIYFPENPPLAEVLADARHSGLKPWPDENDYRGLLREPTGPARGTLLLLHGNAGRAGQRDAYAHGLGRLGLRVILAEYPAYGARPGRRSFARLPRPSSSRRPRRSPG